MSTERALLAIDAGQTGIRAMLNFDGQKSEKDFPGLRTDLDLFPQLSQVISGSLKDFSGDTSVTIGTTGLTKLNSNAQKLLDLLDSKVKAVYLAHDSVSGFLGSMGLNHGSVTAVGTGVVSMGVGPKKSARVDGWGNLIGDAGSAYWIGRAGLEAAMKAYDGRIAATSLIEILKENFSSPEEAYIDLQTDDNRVARIASFARRVIELTEGDLAAREIIQQAAQELALSAVTAARNAGVLEDPAPKFSWAGNVMKADLLREAFIAEIIRSVPNAQVLEPIGTPIDGVALLPKLDSDSPLLESVYRSSRN